MNVFLKQDVPSRTVGITGVTVRRVSGAGHSFPDNLTRTYADTRAAVTALAKAPLLGPFHKGRAKLVLGFFTV